MGTKKHPGQYDCYAKAAPDEPMMVLLGRDLLAPGLTNLWALLRAGNQGEARIAFNELLSSAAPYILEPDSEKPAEAVACAAAMFEWRKAREVARRRIAEIDKKFDEAEGWGSWMVMVANEREGLANYFGFEHKHQARSGGGGRTS